MGEFELLAEIRRRLSSGGDRVLLGPGDDAAAVKGQGVVVTSVDAVVEGIHFQRPAFPLDAIGGKALAAALSDLAAMGVEAGEAYTVIGIPVDLDEEGCLEILSGLESVARATGTVLAGGDLSRSPVLFLAITVTGHASDAGKLVARGGARPGDLLAVTGELGGAAAGLVLLTQPGLAGSIDPVLRAQLTARQLAPVPRLEAGVALAAAGASAMIDISDGLGGDAVHLATASGVRAEIEAARLPLAPGLAEVAAAVGDDPLELAVSGGEDYELLVALDPSRLEAASGGLASMGLALTPVGEVSAGEGVEIRRPDGGRLEPLGFDQLRGPGPG